MEAGAAACPGSLTFTPAQQLRPVFSHPRGSAQQGDGQELGYPLLGAAELALKLPKMGDQESWNTSPPISWQR